MSTRMPFGRHKGVLIEDLPLDYLYWLDTKVVLREPMRCAVRRALDAQVDREPTAAGMTIMVVPTNVALVKQIVDAGYRTLAGRPHPDIGGSTNEMQRLNEVVGSLRSQLAYLQGGRQ